MKDRKINFAKLSLGLYISLSTALSSTAFSAAMPLLTPNAELNQQRQLFNQAREAIKLGRNRQANKLARQLEQYPLYPYLRYWPLYRKKARLKARDLNDFLQEYGDTHLAPRLQKHWLKNLAKQGQWQTLAQHYQPSNDVELQCYYRRAVYKNGDHQQAFDGIEKLWLVGKSQPRACDPLFSAWQETPSFNADLAWQRVQLAMEKRQSYLARYLERFLDDKHQLKSQQWRQIHQRPESILNNKQLHGDNQWNRFLLGYGVKRLAQFHPNKAANFWDKITLLYAFEPSQSQSIERYLALRLAKHGDAQAAQWLKHLDDNSAEVNEWRILTAIREQHWQDVLFWYEQMSPVQRQQNRWRYWQARALEQLEFHQQANTLFKSLAKQRSYYGFLAADKSQQDYALQHTPLEYQTSQLQALAQQDNIARAREFFALGDLVNARREWYQAGKKLSREDNLKAAKLAQQWGWHDRAINTLGNAGYWDDIEIRFPLVHNSAITHHASQQHVDPAWAYAVIRQESAFTPDARSPKGALGLMQIMPSTGKFIAKALNTTLSHNYQLIDVDTNIRFGINYLNTVLNRFDQNMVLATAAYNAGTSRVKSWLPKDQEISADQWIEHIPYKETRQYVKNVLAYTTIYDTRLDNRAAPISQRMPDIKSKN